MSYIDDFFKRSDTKIATGIACVALFLGSFGDEATQVMFALRFSETGQTAPAQVSALLAAGLLGGISAGFFTSFACIFRRSACNQYCIYR